VSTRPFHHGNLRAVLLEQAEVMLRDSGVDGLSLRELARQAGVSHGAPRSHFIDKRALLDALAERGFDRLTERVASVLAERATFEERFRLVGRAYVEFGVDDAALMELMFAAQLDDPSGRVNAAAARLFETLDGALGARQTAEDADKTDDDADDAGAARLRFKLLFAATMQGTSTLIASRRVTRTIGMRLVDDATGLLLASALGRSILPPPDQGAVAAAR
jgi:AcrR family transcriptional regulator